MDINPGWFDPLKKYFRSRSGVMGNALKIAVDVSELPFELCDSIDTALTTVAIHRHAFDPERHLKFVCEVFVVICRFLGIEKSHSCLDEHGTVDGIYHIATISALLHKVCFFGLKGAYVKMSNELFLEKLEYCAQTIINGGGGYGTQGRSISRSLTPAASPAPSGPDSSSSSSSSHLTNLSLNRSLNLTHTMPSMPCPPPATLLPPP